MRLGLKGNRWPEGRPSYRLEMRDQPLLYAEPINRILYILQAEGQETEGRGEISPHPPLIVGKGGGRDYSKCLKTEMGAPIALPGGEKGQGEGY